MTYDEFKTKVINLLTNNQTGLTWTLIKEKLQLPQAVPNNQWVMKLENECGMARRKDCSETFWYMPNKGTTYTIGYEGKSISQFIERLKKFEIKQLVDVREIALSRKNGFAKTSLRKALDDNAIVYKHFPELGSPSEIRHKLHENWDYNLFFKEYTAYIETEEPKKALNILSELAHMRKTVIMCFEYSVEKCHRRILKERLIADGFGVVDL